MTSHCQSHIIAEQNDVALRITRIYRQYNHIRILQYSPTPQGSTRKDSRPLVRATSSREILPNRHPGAVALRRKLRSRRSERQLFDLEMPLTSFRLQAKSARPKQFGCQIST